MVSLGVGEWEALQNQRSGFLKGKGCGEKERLCLTPPDLTTRGTNDCERLDLLGRGIWGKLKRLLPPNPTDTHLCKAIKSKPITFYLIAWLVCFEKNIIRGIKVFSNKSLLKHKCKLYSFSKRHTLMWSSQITWTWQGSHYVIIYSI